MPAASRIEKLAVFNEQSALLNERVNAEQSTLTQIVGLESQIAVCMNKNTRAALVQQLAEAQALLPDFDAAIVGTANYVSAIAASIASGGELPPGP